MSLSTMGRSYCLDFNSMQQINEDTGTARSVQRKANPAAAPASGKWIGWSKGKLQFFGGHLISCNLTGKRNFLNRGFYIYSDLNSMQMINEEGWIYANKLKVNPNTVPLVKGDILSLKFQ